MLVALIALVAIGGSFTQLEAGKSDDVRGTSDCTASNRVTLVVDFGDSRKVQFRCAANFNGTGWQLFSATATEVTGTDQYPEGFVCRIEGYPTAADQSCHSTPTYAQGGWAYFYKSSETNGKWLFSPTGSALRKPVCGSLEGWRYFASNKDPASSPPRSNLAAFKC